MVDAEKQKFEEAIQSSLSDAVLEKQKTVERLSKQNEQASSEIQRLTQTMAESQNQIASLQVEISVSNSALNQKKVNFDAAYQKIKSEMQTDLEKVKLYIGSAPSPTPKTKKSTKK